MSPKLKDKPPLNAVRNPNSLISSKNLAVFAIPVFLTTIPIISRRDFLVNSSLIYPTS